MIEKSPFGLVEKIQPTADAKLAGSKEEGAKSDSPIYRCFNLREEPFAPTADPKYFYFTKEYRECMYRIKNSISSRQGIVLLFGNYGSGKTSLMRTLISNISQNGTFYTNTAIISSPNPSWSVEELLEAIVTQFKIEIEGDSTYNYTNSLNKFLFDNKNCINTLFIDDGQNLKEDHIELLRLIQNLESPQHKLLNIVIFGQLEMIPLIESQVNFSQRVNTAFVLNPLDFEDTKNLISFRLHQAGLAQNEDIFNGESYQIIYEFSQGIPREIVTICRNSLGIANRIGKRRIDQRIILYTIKNTTLKGLSL